MAALASLSGLSQLIAWPTEHLTDAAEHWETVAARNYEVANQVWRDALSVGWQGQTANTIRTAAHSDMITVGATADQLQTAAQVARSGASDLYAARSRLRYAIEAAFEAGFDVDEEMSVIDTSFGGLAAERSARQAEADALATDIRQRAEQLVAVDEHVAGKVSAAVSGIRGAFPQSPTTTTPAPPRRPDVRAVDNQTFKEDPAPPPDPSGDAPWEKRPSPKTLEDVREAMRQLRPGKSGPHRELDTPEEIQEFYEWLTRNSVSTLPPFGFPRRGLEDGTVIEKRPNSGSGGPVIEIKPPDAKRGPKVHLPLPFVDESPQLPTEFNHPPVTLPPPTPGHPLPAPLPPAQFSDPADLPPWLRDPSPPGFAVSPAQPPSVFGWDHPDTSAPPAAQSGPQSQDGQSWLPDITHDLREAGTAALGLVMVGGVLVWTVLGPGQSSQVSAP